MLLKIGSTGDDVKKLQERLGLKADGSFGAVTEAKVKAWQQANGLKVDGVIGDISWKVLFPDASAPKVDAGTNANTSSTTGTGKSNLPFDKLKGAVPDNVLAQLPDACAKFEVNNIFRLAHFMAQCAHESAEFKFVDENLNYSADGLKKIFPKYFPGDLSASYARSPKKIGARVYANRMGNGDEASGEGYLYHGRGYIQLTGKNNYRSFAQFIGEDTVANPDLVANKYPLASAAFFFAVNKLWDVCDQGASDAVVTAVTKRVNGGTIGLPDRLAHFKKYYACLTK
jgi:putative chitinase